MPRHRVLVLFAHPTLERSRVNRCLIDAASGLSGVSVCDLYERYPDFDVDVAAEQERLSAHDVIVSQHPFFWYSGPALLKQWQDLVLEHGWAYGREGNALRGKLALNAVTTGGGEGAYQDDGFNHHRMAEFLLPFEQTAKLCGMRYLPPFIVHGTHTMTAQTIERHAADYGRLLCALRDGTLDLASATQQARLNADLDALIDEAGVAEQAGEGNERGGF